MVVRGRGSGDGGRHVHPLAREAREGQGPNISAPGPKAPEACWMFEVGLSACSSLNSSPSGCLPFVVFLSPLINSIKEKTLLPGAWGGPGLTGRSFQKSTFFPHRFFDVFFMVLASILDDLFDDFPMFFASLVRHLFFMFF